MHSLLANLSKSFDTLLDTYCKQRSWEVEASHHRQSPKQVRVLSHVLGQTCLDPAIQFLSGRDELQSLAIPIL